MESVGRDLLRRLGAGVRPGAPLSGARGRPLDGSSFDELVSMARAGRISSGRGLDVSSDVRAPLDGATIERLSVVTDAAEAAGFARIGAVIEEAPEEEGEAPIVRVAVIDVRARLVESAEEDAGGRFVSGVEAFVRVPGVDAQELRAMVSEEAGSAHRGAGGAPLLGARPIANASLGRLLGGG
jgi:hypothetical protein